MAGPLGCYATTLFGVVGLGLLLGRGQALKTLEQFFLAHVLGR